MRKQSPYRKQVPWLMKQNSEIIEQSTRHLRVLMIAPTSFFSDYGCHVRIYEEAKILQKLGHRVTVLPTTMAKMCRAGYSTHIADPLATTL